MTNGFVLKAAIATGILAISVAPVMADGRHDGDRGWHGGHDHDGWRHGDDWRWNRPYGARVYVAPPAYYAPPRVYYAPPPVYYAPPPVYYAPPPVAVYPAAPGLSIGVNIPLR
jgi:hypothetical protein